LEGLGTPCGLCCARSGELCLLRRMGSRNPADAAAAAPHHPHASGFLRDL